MQRLLASAVFGLLLVGSAALELRRIQQAPADEGEFGKDVGVDAEEADATSFFGPLYDVPLLDVSTGAVTSNVAMRFADTPPRDHRGLMFRRHLYDNEGMLFLYTEPGHRVLWMKNTLIGLDAAWFTGDLTMQEVHRLLPLDLTYRYSDRYDITLGLEMPAGFFEKRGIKPGSVKLDPKALHSALADRGLDPSLYIKIAETATETAPGTSPEAGGDAQKAAATDGAESSSSGTEAQHEQQ
eukprot:TRINITY_DN104926_c0_g1_i1.p1 TRINITY_DN104926_c0_g1~~TRINITY_DN104926_c0_g1_i1.p1  ORF type:complete len:276 (-),score=62.34 TRINITY_DN104926_c0_g1_i1:31-750(-)